MGTINATLVAQTAANELIGATLRAGKTIRLTVPTQSMFPLLAPGDEVTARPLRSGEPRPGDITLAWDGTYWIAHRVVEKQMTKKIICYLTKGDNCNEPDSLWSADQICAKIIAVEKNNRVVNLESKRATILGIAIAQFTRIQLRVARGRPRIQRIFAALIER